MFELLLLLGIVYWIGSDLGDSAGTIALWVLIGALVIGLLSAGRKCNRAFGNFIDHWADKGN